MDPELLRKISPKDYYEAYYKEGLRPDNRKINKPRKYAINVNTEENSCLVRIGSTAVICKILEGFGFEGWEDLSYLGSAKGKTKIIILSDDGNLIEAVGLSYQFAIKKEEILFPFTFAEVFGHYIRDPTKEEEGLSDSLFTVFVSFNKFNIFKTKGSPISLVDIERLIITCQALIHIAYRKTELLRSNQIFVGKLYSNKNNRN